MFCVVLIITAIYDVKTRTIPLIFPVSILCLSLFEIDLIQSLAGCLISGSIFGLGAILSKGKIGGGDFKLMAACGFFLGVMGVTAQAVIGLTISCIIGIIIAILKKQRLNETSLPLAPGLCVGGVFVCIANLL